MKTILKKVSLVVLIILAVIVVIGLAIWVLMVVHPKPSS